MTAAKSISAWDRVDWPSASATGSKKGSPATGTPFCVHAVFQVLL